MYRGLVGARWIAEFDVLETQGAPDRSAQRRRIVHTPDFRIGVEQFADPPERTGAAQQLAPDFGQSADRAGRDHRIEDELGQHAGIHLASDHLVRAGPEDQGDGAETEQDDQGGQQCSRADAFACGGQGALDRLRITLALARLARVGLHGVDRIQGLRGDRRGIGDAVLALPRQPFDATAEDHDRQDHGRNDQRSQTGQARAGDDEHGRRADQHDRAAQRQRQGRADHGLHEFGVGGQARNQFAGARTFEKGLVQGQQVRIQAAAQVRCHALAEQGHAEIPRRAGNRHDHGDAEQADETRIELGRIGLAETTIDHEAGRSRQGQGGGR